jgi:hypothetical protein
MDDAGEFKIEPAGGRDTENWLLLQAKDQILGKKILIYLTSKTAKLGPTQ